MTKMVFSVEWIVEGIADAITFQGDRQAALDYAKAKSAEVPTECHVVGKRKGKNIGHIPFKNGRCVWSEGVDWDKC